MKTHEAESPPAYPLLYSLSGFRYCALFLTEAERAAWQATMTVPKALDCGSLLRALPGTRLPRGREKETTPIRRQQAGWRKRQQAPQSKALGAVSERAAQAAESHRLAVALRIPTAAPGGMHLT